MTLQLQMARHRVSGPRPSPEVKAPMQEHPTKTCTKCGATRPLEAFNRKKDGKYGRDWWCKICTRERAREWKRRNPEKAKANRQQGKKDRPKVIGAWDQRNPDKRKANRDLSNAIAAGQVVKPDRCTECGEPTPPRQLHGHHHDYSKPFDVRWLCLTCHNAEHVAERNAAIEALG